jgi:hypothetical protein
MKKVITLITFLFTFFIGYSQSISPRLWVNNTYYVFDSIQYFSNLNQLLDSLIIEVSETDSVTFELHHTNLYHDIIFYGTVTPAEFHGLTTNFCTQNSTGIGQVQIQGTKIDYMPFLITDEEFFCFENEIYFFFYNYIFHEDIGGFELLHYIKLVRPQPLSVNEFSPPKIKLFPNPTYDWLTIEYDASTLSSAITIYDISGGKVKQLSTDIKNQQHTVDVSDLTPGVYFVEINDNIGNSVYEKFVVLR